MMNSGKRLQSLIFMLLISMVILACSSSSSSNDTGASKCSIPVFSPIPGNFASDQYITITTDTEDADIFYTTDSTTPTKDSAEYTAQIPVEGNGKNITIKAIAVKSGMSGSDVATGTFIINYSQVASPQISPAPVNFTIPLTVSITCETEGAMIRYTTDDTDPSETSGVIISSGDSFTLNTKSVVKVIAYKTGMLTSSIAVADYSFKPWIWMSGSNSTNQNGVYGTKGEGSVSNIPGARSDAVSWRDSSGNLWLFGGYGYGATNVIGFLNDLWKYEPSTGKWTWVSGSNALNQSGTYGNRGEGSVSNIPGGRADSISWIDSSGNLWLFGGVEVSYYKNDLWKYEPSTNKWTWVSGSYYQTMMGPTYGTKGVGSTSNIPGERCCAISWMDSSGNLWLFGGGGLDVDDDFGYLNDLWKYEPSTDKWTWVSGSDTRNQSGTYGTMGEGSTSNIPPSRYNSFTWVDSSGNFWLFGGNGYDSEGNMASKGGLNDLWKYEPSANRWTWVSGSNSLNQSGTYGTRGEGSVSNIPGGRVAGASWIDSSGDFWLFGGAGYDSTHTVSGYGTLNELWKYEPSTGKWTWVSGSNLKNPVGVYGTKGELNSSNTPCGRSVFVSWVDSSGNFWLFGGNNGTNRLNDLWKYEP